MALLLTLSYKRQIQNVGTEEIDFEDSNLTSDAELTNLFSVERWQELMVSIPELMLARALAEAGEIPLYKSHPYDARDLFATWEVSTLQPDLQTYVRKHLADDANGLYDLLAAYSSRIGGRGAEYLANLSRTGVSELNQKFGIELFRIAQNLLPGELVTKYPGRDPDQPTDQDRLRQFIYLYEQLFANLDN